MGREFITGETEKFMMVNGNKVLKMVMEYGEVAKENAI